MGPLIGIILQSNAALSMGARGDISNENIRTAERILL
jgi:hypothetical protein